jgi:hypothetical protein
MVDRDSESLDWSASTIHSAPAHRRGDPPADGPRRAPSFGGPPRRPGSRGPARDFIRRYGWRAYALPLLAVVSVVAVLAARSGPAKGPAYATDAGSTHQPRAQLTPSSGPSTGSNPSTHSPSPTPAPPTASGTIVGKADHASGNALETVLKAAALPPGRPYTTKGTGTFRVLMGTTKIVGHGRLYRYDIEIENGITGIDVAAYASLVDRTLDDPRSWSGHGVSLERVDSGPVDFHITLTSALTVRALCGYTLSVESSCYAAAGTGSVGVNRVILDDARWVRGATAYVGDLTAYRQYMINHEDGHALGHIHAHECLSDGLAPTMMQQTFGLRSAATGKLCQANPWPYPPGATDAPGAEQPDTSKNNEYNLGD